MAWMPGCATQQWHLPAGLQRSAPARLRSHTCSFDHQAQTAQNTWYGLPGKARPEALLSQSLRLAEHAR